ncbi:MAG: hypothetical protein F4Y16_10050 [Holophagales bacterium]|nr:hypothetical protein [Holophagales bacterium]MYH23991.1 hypothetical protein [Holophagales bacterium]
MSSPRIADLTVSEFKDLVHEAVTNSIAELLGDPDRGLELRDDFAEELRKSLADPEAEGGTVGLSEVAASLGSPH